MFCFILFFGKRGLHFALSVGGSHQEANNYLTALFGDVLVDEGEGEGLDKPRSLHVNQTNIVLITTNKGSIIFQFHNHIPLNRLLLNFN